MQEAAVPDSVARAEALYRDVDLAAVTAWKGAHPGDPAIGYLPVYVPREVIHAAGGLPVALYGGGDQVEVVRGDAYIQSYICHLPRSVIELGQSGRLDGLDGLVCPSTCDVIRNLSGMWQMLYPGRYVRYLDLPQNFKLASGGAHYAHQLRELGADVAKMSGRAPTDADLRRSIELHNRNRRLLRALYDLRASQPHVAPTSEVYLVVRAGATLPVDDHSDLVAAYLREAPVLGRRPMDNARIVLSGMFCEQPPLGLLRTIERAGCYIVDDDLLLGARWLVGDVDEEMDPMRALCTAYLEHSCSSPIRYEPERPKGEALVQIVRSRRAEGVLFAAPSFCDPALLERPMLAAACERAGIPYSSFQYAENTGEFQGFREQAGTFSDSIKLWGEGDRP